MAGIVTTSNPSNLRPAWHGDVRGVGTLIPGGARLDPTLFRREDAVVVDVAAAGAAAGATTLPVTALSGPIPVGTILDFGTNKFARLTAAAAAGATSLTVAALPTALVDADVATYPGTKAKLIPSGTLLGRTIAERNAGTGFGPWVTGDDATQTYLLAFDVHNADTKPECELYRHGSLVKDNQLPASSQATAELAQVRARYECTRGTN